MSLDPGVAHGQNGSRHINEALEDAVRHDVFTVATIPHAADHATKIVAVSDGDTGKLCLAYSNGANWLRIVLGAAVSAT
ncbi:hypothetical protein [Bradyrhizobium erythrophlei]|uniref:hypothetical protein n=1 Tax=Bradyrhizobium erythrophlei TaxID=1437360 RepID=UPI0009A8552F|nr:hypothetical protein [Bradyrhizobium erythrophlei]